MALQRQEPVARGAGEEEGVGEVIAGESVGCMVGDGG